MVVGQCDNDTRALYSSLTYLEQWVNMVTAFTECENCNLTEQEGPAGTLTYNYTGWETNSNVSMFRSMVSFTCEQSYGNMCNAEYARFRFRTPAGTTNIFIHDLPRCLPDSCVTRQDMWTYTSILWELEAGTSYRIEEMEGNWECTGREDIKVPITTADAQGNVRGSNSSSSGSNIGLIAGLVAGAVVVVVLGILFVIFKRRKLQKGKQSEQFQFEEIESPSLEIEFNMQNDVKSVTSSMATGTSSSVLHPKSSRSLDTEALPTGTLDASAIVIHEVLGNGSFGEVFRAEYAGSNIAVKRLLGDQNTLQLNSFEKEIQMLQTLRHPNIVQFLGTAILPNQGFCVVTEFMERGDLTTVLQQVHAGEVELPWFSDSYSRFQIVQNITSGLAYLHHCNPPVIHRDLKSRNILISSHYVAKIADFGLSRVVSTTTTMTAVGSNLWLPPEIIKGEFFTEKADMYSFGVVLTELDTTMLPYHDAIQQTTYGPQRLAGIALLHKVAYESLRPTLSTSCPSIIKNLATKCMLADPSLRPTPLEALAMLKNQ